MGDSTLAEQFPALHDCARDRLAKVGDYMNLNEGQVLWCPVFRRNMTKSEEDHLLELLHILNWPQITEGAPNHRLWSYSKDGGFSVSSFSFLFHTTGSPNFWTSLWKVKAPPRVLAFAWLALHGSILAMDSL